MLELFYFEAPDSICSNRVLMTLAEKGIQDWVPRKLVLMNGDQFDPAYVAINPKAQVPTLVHDGRPVRESSVICKYLDGLRPKPKLSPDDPVERAYLDEWIKDSDESGYQATATLNFVTKFRLTDPVERMEARWKSVTDIDRLHRQQSCIREGMQSPYLFRAMGAWERTFDHMEQTLSDGRPWIMGDQLTLVETCYAPFVKVLDMIRFLDLWLDGRAHTRRWWEAVSSRDSMRSLDEYPGQYQDENAVHAVAGRKCLPEARTILEEYRKWARR